MLSVQGRGGSGRDGGEAELSRQPVQIKRGPKSIERDQDSTSLCCLSDFWDNKKKKAGDNRRMNRKDKYDNPLRRFSL